ncbi:MAG: hypothetical protein UW94_C0005G0095 [Parcubacteria group bacterium GW2011_GWA2_45_14]|nr:MAG: hypothetical protein UW94_C0005G0095 [Parcubacteria group bacterium GW2011_GWA2_45_14]
MARIIIEPRVILALATRGLDILTRAFLAIIFSIAQRKVAAKIISSPRLPEKLGSPDITRLPPSNRVRAAN